jgi:hypothetical protein
MVKKKNTRKNIKNGQEKKHKKKHQEWSRKTQDLRDSCYKKSVCTNPLSFKKRLEQFTVKPNIHFSMLENLKARMVRL